MWHYVEGIKNWNPIWTNHAIRILPGPSSLWLDARGRRLPAPLYPGFDTLGTLTYIMETGFDYSWFILTRRIIAKEFALSGAEQNPDLTGKSWCGVLMRPIRDVPAPLRAFIEKGEDFIVEAELSRLVKRMNALTGDGLLTVEGVEREIRARDRQIDNPFSRGLDTQKTSIKSAFLGCQPGRIDITRGCCKSTTLRLASVGRRASSTDVGREAGERYPVGGSRCPLIHHRNGVRPSLHPRSGFGRTQSTERRWSRLDGAADPAVASSS